MPALERRLTVVRRLSRLCAALVLAIVALSAYLRLADSVTGCTPWPPCIGQRTATAPSTASAAARLAHRVVASIALLLLVTLAAVCYADRPWLRREGGLTLALLALALALAVLGRYSAGTPVPAVAVGNLLGGLLMLALCVRLAWPSQPASATVSRWATLALVALLLQLVLGALVSTTHAAGSCDGWADCATALRQAPEPWRAFDIRQPPVFDAAASPPNRAAAPLLALHHVGGLLAGLAVLVLAMAAARARRRTCAVLLLALLALQGGLGSLLTGVPTLAPALLHNSVAALLLAAVARLPMPAAAAPPTTTDASR